MVECEFDKLDTDETAQQLVLIDTWWNVNCKPLHGILYTFGFNRYMVECELDKLSCNAKIKRVLIDTWWNVNEVSVRNKDAERKRFNRYMVECELK